MMWICRDCAETHCIYIDDSSDTTNPPVICPRTTSRGEPDIAGWRALLSEERCVVEYVMDGAENDTQ